MKTPKVSTLGLTHWLAPVVVLQKWRASQYEHGETNYCFIIQHNSQGICINSSSFPMTECLSGAKIWSSLGRSKGKHFLGGTGSICPGIWTSPLSPCISRLKFQLKPKLLYIHKLFIPIIKNTSKWPAYWKGSVPYVRWSVSEVGHSKWTFILEVHNSNNSRPRYTD